MVSFFYIRRIDFLFLGTRKRINHFKGANQKKTFDLNDVSGGADEIWIKAKRRKRIYIRLPKNDRQKEHYRIITFEKRFLIFSFEVRKRPLSNLMIFDETAPTRSEIIPNFAH